MENLDTYFVKFLLFSLILLLFSNISCQKLPQGVTQYKKQWEETGFIEKVKNLEFSSLDLNNLSKDEKLFFEIVNLILKSDFPLVEKKVKEAINTSTENPFKYEYLQFLAFSLFFQSKWKEMLPTSNLYYYDPDSVFLLARVFAKIDTQQVFFSKNVDTIQFFTAPNGAIILSVVINGRTRNFLFDTGTNYTIVSSKSAEDCNIPIITNEKSKAITYSDYRVDVIPTFIHSLKIKNLEIKNHPCLIVDDFNLKLNLISSKVPYEIYGIIGWKAIQNAKFTIDYQNRIIIVEKPLANQKSRQNFFWFGIPILIANAFDRKILFTLDLGSEQSYLTHNIFNKIDFQKTYEQTKKIGSVGGWKFNPTIVVPYFEFYLDTFKVTFQNIPTLSLRKNYFFNIDGILGLDFVKQAKFSFDILSSNFTILK